MAPFDIAAAILSLRPATSAMIGAAHSSSLAKRFHEFLAMNVVTFWFDPISPYAATKRERNSPRGRIALMRNKTVPAEAPPGT